MITLYINGSGVSTLSALASNTKLGYLYAKDSDLGKGVDSNQVDEAYVGIGKSSNNALVSLSNKKSLAYVDCTGCSYLMYTGYLSDLYNGNNTRLKTLYLYGTHAKGAEISSLKNIIKQCISYSLPAGTTFAGIFDASTTDLYLEDEDVYLSDFNTIKTEGMNLTNVEIYNIKIIDDDTETELNSSTYNFVLNDVLGALKSVNRIAVRMDGLSEIYFVKTLTNLKGLDLIDSNVRTVETDENGFVTYGVNNASNVEYSIIDGKRIYSIEMENYTGLELLNYYCSDLKYLNCTAKVNIDFTKIQTAISKMAADGLAGDDGKGFDGYVTRKTHFLGLTCNNQTSLDSLKNCTEITSFIGWNYASCNAGRTLDISNCKKLKSAYLWGNAAAGSAKFILPDESQYVDDNGEKGYELYVGHVHNTILSGGNGCKELIFYRWWGPNDSTGFVKNFNGLENSTMLKKISISVNYWGGDSCNYAGSGIFTILKTCPNLEYFSWSGSGRTETWGNFEDLSELSNVTSLNEINITDTIVKKIPDLSGLTSLTKLSIKNSQLIDINGLKNCTTLEELDLSGNKYIYDLTAIGTLSSLTTLNLSDNAIEDEKSSVENGEFNNINILNTLRSTYSQLTTLSISKNKLSDTGKNSLSWATSL